MRPADDRPAQAGGWTTAHIKKLLDDPTVVFVVLGYADQKGNDKLNADISLSRATSVIDTLREKCGFQNVMHAVAMGGSTLFSKQAGREKPRGRDSGPCCP